MASADDRELEELFGEADALSVDTASEADELMGDPDDAELDELFAEADALGSTDMAREGQGHDRAPGVGPPPKKHQPDLGSAGAGAGEPREAPQGSTSGAQQAQGPGLCSHAARVFPPPELLALGAWGGRGACVAHAPSPRRAVRTREPDSLHGMSVPC